MALPVPNLDDRTFDQLVTEAQSLIPKNFAAWTDYNASDPGTTLAELFAFLTEAAIYQINRIPERSLENFARLIDVNLTRAPDESIDGLLGRALDSLQQKARAITGAEFESLVTGSQTFLTCLPPLQRDHQAGTPVVIMGIAPGVAALALPTKAGAITLIFSVTSTVEPNDEVMIDDGDITEFIQVISAQPVAFAQPPNGGGSGPSNGILVTISSPLRFSHSENTCLNKILLPIPDTATALAASAKTGQNAVVIRPLELPPLSGVLQIDTETVTEYVRVSGIARAKALVDVIEPAEQFVKIVIVPNDPGNSAPTPTDDLRQLVFEFLRRRCLITTRLQVLNPEYVDISISVTVVRDLASRLNMDTVQRAVEQALRDFVSPVTSGANRTGWEFGRSVFRSELYQIIESISGVDHVKKLSLKSAGDSGAGDEQIGEIRLPSPLALVKLDKLVVAVVDR